MYMPIKQVSESLMHFQIAKIIPTPHHDDSSAISNASHDEQGEKSSGSEKVADEYHVCGDIIQVCGSSSHMLSQANEYIIQLISCTEDITRRAPYITASGAAFNADKTKGVFDCNPSQFTTFNKDHRNLSTLPIRAHFDDVRYKNTKPIPSNNNYVTVEGFLTHVDIDPNNAQATLFHIDAENISFLGKAVLPNNSVVNQGKWCMPAKLDSRLTVFKHRLPLHAP